VAELLRASPPEALLFVNLHPTDLEDPEIYSDDGALTPYANRVVLEITERAALDQIHELGTRVTRLRSLGYRLAIDDLGAGYAGLTSFAQLEPEVVKVDMSLVRGIDASPVKQKLVRSIVALCTELGIRMVAEGIETAAERDMLVGLGGDLCQGYLFAKPGRGLPDPKF
jgi:EAL domain-containing protein (putative c-di-GMP-specific phosphodiesterase class I)